MAVFLGVSVKWAKDELPHFQDIGGTIGTLVSGFFLVLIGVLNLIILISLINLFAKLRREHIEEAEVDALLESRGLVSRFVGPYFKLITRSWHVLPLGFYLDLVLIQLVKLRYSLFLQAHHNKPFHLSESYLYQFYSHQV